MIFTKGVGSLFQDEARVFFPSVEQRLDQSSHAVSVRLLGGSAEFVEIMRGLEESERTKFMPGGTPDGFLLYNWDPYTLNAEDIAYLEVCSVGPVRLSAC